MAAQQVVCFWAYSCHFCGNSHMSLFCGSLLYLAPSDVIIIVFHSFFLFSSFSFFEMRVTRNLTRMILMGAWQSSIIIIKNPQFYTLTWATPPMTLRETFIRVARFCLWIARQFSNPILSPSELSCPKIWLPDRPQTMFNNWMTLLVAILWNTNGGLKEIRYRNWWNPSCLPL